MKPTIQLINALRKAADRIETSKPVPPFEERARGKWFLRTDVYHWGEPCACNCGILAQELGLKAEQIDKSGIVLWGQCASSEFRCEAIGMAMQDVFAYLSQFGLEACDFEALEYLRDSNIRMQIGATEPYPYGKQHFVARYFRAQADILEEQLGDKFETRPLLPVTKPEPVEVV